MSCGKDQSISDNIKTNILNTHPNTKFLKNMTRNLSGAAEAPPATLSYSSKHFACRGGSPQS